LKHLFIINPVAGGSRKRFLENMQTITEFAQTLRDPFEIYITHEQMDACDKILKEAEKNPAEELRIYA